MRSSQRLKVFFEVVNALAEKILLLTLGGLFVTVIIQIIGRIVGMPAPWTEEGTRYLFLWMMFIALAYGFRFGESARVNVFMDLLPAPVRKLSGYIYLVATIGFFVFIAVYGGELVIQQVAMNEKGAAIMIPMAAIGMTLPVSGVLGVITTFQCLIETPEKIFGGIDL
nr:TRAP transporter small permease [Anaerotalea alkaliphila]